MIWKKLLLTFGMQQLNFAVNNQNERCLFAQNFLFIPKQQHFILYLMVQKISTAGDFVKNVNSNIELFEIANS